MSWTELASLKCRTCGGSKRLDVDDESPSLEINYHGPCPDCQATGLLLPELSAWCERCNRTGWMIGFPETPCDTCTEGRILLEGPALTLGAEAVLGRYGQWCYDYMPETALPHEYTHYKLNGGWSGTDRQETLRMAVEALVKE